MNKAFPWSNPNTASPDFWHTCLGIIPNGGAYYYQQDHTGVGGGFVGIYTFIAGSFINYQSREYPQVRLTDSLKQGHHYCIEFYESLTEQSGIANSDIGVYISDSAIFENSINHIPVIPQIENPVSNMLTDMVNWMKVSGIYLAHGGEQYITVGNFRDSASSHAVVVNAANYQFAYYLIDDVSVINCDSLFIDVNEINLNAVVSIYPNPVKDELIIDFKGYALEDVQVHILDMMGKMLTGNAGLWQNKIKIDTSSLAAGLYIAEIRSKNGIVAKKFFKE